MPYAKMMLNRTCILWLTIAIIGCSSTVTPVKVASGQPSWDGTNQNSGILNFSKQTKTAFVTTAYHDRYVILAGQYGKNFIPPIVDDRGMVANPDGTYTATAQVIANMGIMEIYKKAGR